MKCIQGEPEQHTKLREKQVMDNLKTEIDLMELRSDSHLTKALNADKEIKAKISSQCTGDVEKALKLVWLEETSKQEEISMGLWEKKNKPFWAKYQKEFNNKFEPNNPFIKEDTKIHRERPANTNNNLFTFFRKNNPNIKKRNFTVPRHDAPHNKTVPHTHIPIHDS